MDPFSLFMGSALVAALSDCGSAPRRRRASSGTAYGAQRKLQMGPSSITAAGGSAAWAMSAATGMSRGGGGPSSAMFRRTIQKYIDFLRLYRGLAGRDLEEMQTTLENADGPMMTQALIDLKDEVAAEAKRRGVHPKEVLAEFEARAKAAGMESARK